jgi:hypothetical protein
LLDELEVFGDPAEIDKLNKELQEQVTKSAIGCWGVGRRSSDV